MSASHAIAALLLGTALWLGMREVTLYRTRKQRESDLFVYTPLRVTLRALGLSALVAFAVTLVLFETYPPKSRDSMSMYMGVFAVEIVALLIVPFIDMLETRQTAAGGTRSPLAKREKRAEHE